MKSLILVTSLLTIFAGPAFATEDICREEAIAMGYVGALDVLAPCEPKKTVDAEELRIEDRRQKRNAKSDTQPIAKVANKVTR